MDSSIIAMIAHQGNFYFLIFFFFFHFFYVYNRLDYILTKLIGDLDTPDYVEYYIE